MHYILYRCLCKKDFSSLDLEKCTINICSLNAIRHYAKKNCVKKVSLYIKTKKKCVREFSYKNNTTTHMGFIISHQIQLVLFKKIIVYFILLFLCKFF